MTCECGDCGSSAVHRGPGEYHVYRLYDSADRLLYVGATGFLGRRLKRHSDTQPWWSEVARVEALEFRYRCAAFHHEQVELRDRMPMYARWPEVAS